MAEAKPLITVEVGAARLEVCVADITTLTLDAIVNAAKAPASSRSTIPRIPRIEYPSRSTS